MIGTITGTVTLEQVNKRLGLAKEKREKKASKKELRVRDEYARKSWDSRVGDVPIAPEFHEYFIDPRNYKVYENAYVHKVENNKVLIVNDLQQQVTKQQLDKCFTKFGFELTYFYEMLPEHSSFGIRTFNEFQSAMLMGLKDYFADVCDPAITRLFDKMYSDNSIEVPIGTYRDINKAVKDFNKITSILSEWNVYPSSQINRYIEGGCHMNYDLGKYKMYFVDFLTNLSNFMFNHPSIAWAFLSPNDNQSAVCREIPKDFIFGTKGHAIFAREDYIELRFFEMPKSAEELILHHEFSLALLYYIKDVTITGSRIPRLKKFPQTTLKKTIFDLENVCDVLGFNMVDLIGAGKVDNIKTRYSKDYGLDFLI